MQLNESQIEAISCIDHNLQIVACAGSGKTEVITRRIVNILCSKEDVKPENIVAFTFTNYAAENMKERIRQKLLENNVDLDISDMYIGTIHSFCKGILEKYLDEFAGYRVLDSIKEHLFMMKYYKKTGAENIGINRKDVELFSTCFEKMICLYDRKDEWSEENTAFFDSYYGILKQKKYLNFSLLIFEVLNHINQKEIQEYFSKIKYLVVDEYQDVDDLQEHLISHISKCGANICVVGDDDQTIYQFRGSNAGNMIGFSNRYRDVITVNLVTNYRCSKAIVDVADVVIRNNENRISKTMKARDDASVGFIDGKCFIGEEQYSNLADDIINLNNKGINYSDIAILVRSRGHINDIVTALESKDIPYCAEDNTYIFDSNYFELFCHIFEYLQDSSDVNRQRIIDDWKNMTEAKSLKMGLRYLSRASETNERFETIFRVFMDNVDTENTSFPTKFKEAYSCILKDFDQVYDSDSWTVRTNDLTAYLDNMVENEYKRTKLFDDEIKDAVRIMTVHQSKGLEFKAVFIPDMQKGIFPARKVGGKKYYSVLGGIFEEEKDKFETSIEDERKLFYVAITRAIEYLYIYSNVEKTDASVFVQEMNESEFSNIDIIDSPHKSNRKKVANYSLSIDLDDEDDDEVELWQIYDIRSIRRAVLNELYAAAHACHFGGAYIEAEDARSASDEELLCIAVRNGIDVESYRR